jgi:hypothetical protein
VCAAATAHALDVSGRLPFVHESVDVRTAMSPALVVGWLAAAAAVSYVAATTRVMLAGLPGALLVSATPELLGRHDPGAIAEPGAILGSLVQVLLLLAVVAVALLLERRLGLFRPHQLMRPAHAVRHMRMRWVGQPVVDGDAAPRAPPLCVQSTT